MTRTERRPGTPKGAEQFRMPGAENGTQGRVFFGEPNHEQAKRLNAASEQLQDPRSGIVVVKKITGIPGAAYDIAYAQNPYDDGVGGWRTASAESLMREMSNADPDYVRAFISGRKGIVDENAAVGALQSRELGGDMLKKAGAMVASMEHGLDHYPSLYHETMVREREAWTKASRILGGHKSVLVLDNPEAFANITPQQRKDLLEKHAELIQELNDKGEGGKFYTAPDMGSHPEDFDYLRSIGFQYIASHTGPGGSGDPSPYTALGVRYAINGQVEHLGIPEDQLRFAIQGAAGEVGHALTGYLREDYPDAGIVLSEVPRRRDEALELAREHYARLSDPDKIYTAGNFFVPSGPAGILTFDRMHEMMDHVAAVGGAANSIWQAGYGEQLSQLYHDNQIHVGPAYLFNQFGIFNIIRERLRTANGEIPSGELVEKAAEGLKPTVLDIFHSARERNIPPERVVNELAMGVYADQLEKHGLLAA